MSLREYVAAFFPIDEPAREKRADEIINTILDKAAYAAEKWWMDKEYAEDLSLDELISEIQALKEGKE